MDNFEKEYNLTRRTVLTFPRPDNDYDTENDTDNNRAQYDSAHHHVLDRVHQEQKQCRWSYVCIYTKFSDNQFLKDITVLQLYSSWIKPTVT